MAVDVKGYDGAVDGVKIHHGIAVAPERQAVVTARLPFQGSQSRPAADIEPIIERAAEVVGNRKEALRWLGTPVRALDYATPISLLDDPATQEKVLAVLTQLEHGVL